MKASQSQQSIFLDVSSTATSPIITGIPRVVRALADKRNRNLVSLVEYDGLVNSYKQIQDLPQMNPVTDDTARKRVFAASQLYKALTECQLLRSVVALILRNRLMFYFARKLLGNPSASGVILDELTGILFLPEVPVHNAHVKKVLALKKSGSIKLALYLHDLLPLQHPEFFSHDLIWKFNNFVPLIEVADIILVSNNDVKSQVEDIFKKSQINVIALPAAFEPSDEKFEFDSRFLVVGTIEPRKNYVAILDAFERLHKIRPEVELRIIGNIGWKYTEIIQRISTLQKRGVKLQWIKNLSDVDLQREYQQAIALLYPSHYEGYGLPVVEALSQSTPVITSNRPAMRLFASFGGVSLIDPENPDELFAEMTKLLDVEYRNAKALEIQLDQIPASWPTFTEQCFLAIKEV